MFRTIPILYLLPKEIHTTFDLIKATLNHLILSKEQIIFLFLSHENSPSLKYHLLHYWLKVFSQLFYPGFVRTILGFQGTPPNDLVQLINNSNLEMILNSQFISNIQSNSFQHILSSGKGENLQLSLYHICKSLPSNINHENVKVITVDDDYLLGHWLNQWLLVIPLLIKRDCKCSLCQTFNNVYCNIAFVKSGSPRIIIKMSDCLKDKNNRIIPKNPIALSNELCSENRLLDLNYSKNNHNDLFNYNQLNNIYNYRWSIDIINSAIASGKIKKGGRTECKIRTILSNNGLREFLQIKQLTFILHGDQGTSLSNWKDISIGKGYLVELMFLFSAIEHVKKWGGIIGDVQLPPHAHIRKTNRDNNIMGLKLLEWLNDKFDTKIHNTENNSCCLPNIFNSFKI